MLQPNLGRSEYMACRMERNVHAIERYRFAVRKNVDGGVFPEPGTEQPLAGFGSKIPV
jgi:hypothetical protein